MFRERKRKIDFVSCYWFSHLAVVDDELDRKTVRITNGTVATSPCGGGKQPENNRRRPIKTVLLPSPRGDGFRGRIVYARNGVLDHRPRERMRLRRRKTDHQAHSFRMPPLAPTSGLESIVSQPQAHSFSVRRDWNSGSDAKHINPLT